jgi:hypothetical protein
MRTGGVARILGVCLGAMLFGSALAAAKPEEVVDDGLVRVEHSLLDELYVSPNASLAHYRRVSIDPVEVGFRKGWRKEHPEMSDKEFDLLCGEFAQSLREALVTELARGGYALTDAAGPDVLRVHASIEKANFASAEAGEDKHTFTRNSGEMTLRVQAFDAPSGVLVARAKDYEVTPQTRDFERADRVSTNAAAHRIFEKWAEEFRSALDVAHVK